jgi:hypothetical protein
MRDLGRSLRLAAVGLPVPEGGHLQRHVPDVLLSIYLNDHLAGSVMGVELARRTKASNEGTELGRVLDEICAEIEADQRTLREVMGHLGVAPSKVKPRAAWLAEKVGRLKPNGRLRGYSPLSRVVELEGLCAGIVAKRQLWGALGGARGSSLPGFDFDALAARADAQRQRLEACRLDAVATAFGSG